MMEYIFNNEIIKARHVEIEDAPHFVKWWNDGALMASVGFKNGLNISLEKVEMKIQKDIDNLADTKLFIIYDSITNVPIGELSYGELDLDQKSCRIGMKICELSYQGKGYGHRALCDFLNYLFENFNLNVIYIDTLLNNTRAINLYKKIGSKTIEIIKDFWTNPEGVSLDAIFFELSRKDFNNYLKSF